MNGCQQYTVYLAAERDGMRAAIAQNKGALSRQIGREVGDDLAKTDFFDRLLTSFACQFRSNYCKTCAIGSQCDVSRCADKLAGR